MPPQLIIPNSQRQETTDLLNLLSQSVQGLMAKKQKDKEFGLRDRQLGMQERQFGMREKQFEEGQQQKQLGRDILNQIGQTETTPARQFTDMGDVQGPLSEQQIQGAEGLRQERLDQLVAKYGRTQGKPTTLKKVQTERGIQEKQLGLIDPKVKQSEIDLKEKQLSFKDRELDFKLKKLASEVDQFGKASMDPDKAFKIEDKIRSEFITQNKEFQKVGDSYNRIEVSAENPSAAGDLALIFNYMKMLDPGSVVRESEFATAAAAGSYGDRIQGAASRIIAGKRLSTDQRKDFTNRSKKLMNAAEKGYTKSLRTYRKLASDYGVDPNRVTIDLGRADTNNQKDPWE